MANEHPIQFSVPDARDLTETRRHPHAKRSAHTPSGWPVPQALRVNIHPGSWGGQRRPLRCGTLRGDALGFQARIGLRASSLVLERFLKVVEVELGEFVDDVQTPGSQVLIFLAVQAQDHRCEIATSESA